MVFLYLVFTLVDFSSQQPQIPENRYEVCSLKMERGDTCCKNPSGAIRFYFDPVLEKCFTYLYPGCGGGRNTFYTESECQNTCIPADKFTCGGNEPFTGTCQESERKCPSGSTCVIGGLGEGLCCDDANEKKWEKETNPTCAVGKVLTRNVFYGTEVWIGKKCSDRFCPHMYDCIQGKRVAHCCGPIPNFKEKFYPDEDFVNPVNPRFDGSMHKNLGNNIEYKQKRT